MKLDQNSVNRIIGSKKEVVVYGLTRCSYSEVIDELSNQGRTVFHAMNYSDSDVIATDYSIGLDYHTTIGRRCKAVITSIVLANYKNLNEGKEITPLLFIVAMSDPTSTLDLNIETIARSRSGSASITDKELRRCFKMTHDLNTDIQAVAMKTLRFAKLVYNKNDCNLYDLVEVQPFWQAKQWSKLWNERKQSKTEGKINQKPWRTIVTNEIQKYHREKLFSQPSSKQSPDHLLTHSTIARPAATLKPNTPFQK